ncbi:MAG: hypothetical protein KF845_03170 [Cyclobacteriaceae bacterium]|nr:hypothetical protein [Cyclobacteriaceae bacterium]
MDTQKTIELAIQVFEKIQSLFPNLTMTINRNPEHVDVSMDILKQPGLDFDIYLNLQNEDEFHIATPDIWCEWFPVNSQIAEECIKAVQGLITGEYRILKFTRNGTTYKALLQSENNGQWATVFSDIYKFKFPWIKLKTQIIKNCSHQIIQ